MSVPHLPAIPRRTPRADDEPRHPAPWGPYAAAEPDGYRHYWCPRCGGELQTTLRARGVYAPCFGGGVPAGCDGALRWFRPRSPHTEERSGEGGGDAPRA